MCFFFSLPNCSPLELTRLLGDDIGWNDFGYNDGIALTPHIDAPATGKGSVQLTDAHSGGTVCSPTRASILTGRTPFRDCVNGVYDCSDPTECPGLAFKFAPNGTFTIANAVRAANNGYKSFFSGKWLAVVPSLGGFFYCVFH